MKLLAFSILIGAGLLLSSCITTKSVVVEESNPPIDLFDGQSLDGWSYVLMDPALGMEDVWTVNDGILVCKGQPFGYLYTNGSYQDFHLVIEWRWTPGTKPGNSGVLMRIASEPVKFMPRCVEAQLESGNAGDLWAFLGAKIDGDPARLREVKGHKDLGDFKGYGKIKAGETTPGHWNRYDITVKGGEIEVRVNGVLVNKAKGLDVLAGPIGLQSEGGQIEFRKVRLTEL